MHFSHMAPGDDEDQISRPDKGSEPSSWEVDAVTMTTGSK